MRVLEPGRHAFLGRRNKLMTWNTNELETLRDVAEKIHELKVVLGGDQLVKLLAKD